MTDQSPNDAHRLLASDGSGNWPNPDNDRAQPGDVLGIERGGETTSLGDTEEEEDERRRDAEKNAPKAPAE
jgi:hypothetical protein